MFPHLVMIELGLKMRGVMLTYLVMIELDSIRGNDLCSHVDGSHLW